MPNCPNDLSFSSVHAEKRRQKAEGKIGKDVVNRIIAFALFLMGANREEIARYLRMPIGTLFSFFSRMSTHGLHALDDRRTTTFSAQSKPVPPIECSMSVDDQHIHISLGPSGNVLNLPRENPLQCKSVLLTFLENNLLKTKDVAEAIGLSARRTRGLVNEMGEHDVLALLDNRAGQQKDYRFTPEAKCELIQQFAVNAITGRPTSSRVLAEDLYERCNLELSDRSIRLHLGKLGMKKIARTLPALVKTIKKTQDLDKEPGE